MENGESPGTKQAINIVKTVNKTMIPNQRFGFTFSPSVHLMLKIFKNKKWRFKGRL
jgi:hypothetical protein